jgi:hypothetical protein
MQPIDEYVQLIRDSHPDERVYRLDFSDVEAMSDALLWMDWARRPAAEEIVVRKGVMARGFDEGGRGVLIVGGELSAEEALQLNRVATRHGGRARALRQRATPAEVIAEAAARYAEISPQQRALWALLAVVTFTLPVLFLWRTAATQTHIGDIRANPPKYAGETVRVRGIVTGAANISGLAAYTVEDPTGRITVIAGGEVPESGTEVWAVGTVVPDFSAGPVTVLAIREPGAPEGTSGRAP